MSESAVAGQMCAIVDYSLRYYHSRETFGLGSFLCAHLVNELDLCFADVSFTSLPRERERERLQWPSGVFPDELNLWECIWNEYLLLVDCPSDRVCRRSAYCERPRCG